MMKEKKQSIIRRLVAAGLCLALAVSTFSPLVFAQDGVTVETVPAASQEQPAEDTAQAEPETQPAEELVPAADAAPETAPAAEPLAEGTGLCGAGALLGRKIFLRWGYFAGRRLDSLSV